MSRAAVSFILLVDGCPVAFGSASCTYADFSTLSCAEDTDFPTSSGFPTSAADAVMWPTIVPASLVLSGWSWEESALNVNESDLQVSAPTFSLYDRPMTIAGTLRANGVTYLATRKAVRGSAVIANSAVTSDVDASVINIDVDAPSLFSSPSVVYIDGEACLVDSIAGPTLELNTNGRGIYNSRALPHSAGARVWAEFPGFDERRVSLWEIDAGTRVAVRKWTGYCRDIERTTGKKLGYTLACDSIVPVERSRPVGIPFARTRLRGYNTATIEANLSWDGGATLGSGTAAFRSTPEEGRVVDTVADMGNRIAEDLRAVLIAAPTSITGPYVTCVEDSRGLTLFAMITTGGATLNGRFGLTRAESVAAASTQTVDPRSVSLTISPLPPVLVFVKNVPGAKTPVESAEGMPATWTPPPAIVDGAITTSFVSVLRGRLDDKTFVVIEPETTEDLPGSPTTNAGPFIVGPVRTESATGEEMSLGLDTRVPVLLETQTLVSSGHWLHAMRYGFVEDILLVNSGADPRDWDFDSTQSSVIAATQDAQSRMAFYTDGSTTVDSVFRERMRMSAVSFGIRGGRISPFAFKPPLPTDTVALTVTPTMLAFAKSSPQWRRLKDALVNTVEVKSGGLDVVVQDEQSAKRYGASKVASVNLYGENEIANGGSDNPFTILSRVLSRMIGTFGQPVSIVTFSLGPSQCEAAALGDYIKLTDWISPNGDGAIGLNETVGQVIVRSPENVGGNGESSVQFTLLLYGLDGLSGFAPAVRADTLDTVNVARDGITADVAYLQSAATDYAGSNTAAYRYASTFPNDGGVSWFVAGQKCRLYERNSVTPRAPESVTLLTVTPSSTPGSSKLVFTAGVNVAWAAIATAGNLDVVPDDYNPSLTAQRLFCYVASQTPPYEIDAVSLSQPKVFT